jgi:indolepyruvate ferredoxin oxidoreductase
VSNSLGDKILKSNSGSCAEISELLISGTQAIVQATLIQKERDEFLGFSTAGYVTGYRGSPLGSVDQEFNKKNNLLKDNSIFFHEALNEDLAATAMVW